jgi:hypothetical protein
MKIRITGLPAEITPVIEALNDAASLDVTEVSDPDPNRGDSRTVRVYITARPHAGSPASLRTWHEVKAELFAGRDEELRAAEEQLRAKIRSHRDRRQRPGGQGQVR